jgi:hypothetical protein
MKTYKGVIIEESLTNNKILKDVKIIKTEVKKVTPRHKTPWLKQWTEHTIAVPEDKAKELAEKISKVTSKEHGWYVDFKNKDKHYVIFHNKVFHVDRDSKEQYEKVKAYGLSVGTPEYQIPKQRGK